MKAIEVLNQELARLEAKKIELQDEYDNCNHAHREVVIQKKISEIDKELKLKTKLLNNLTKGSK